MENISITDLLSQLKEENQRLIEENKVIYEMLNKYRNISLSFQNSCLCNQKSNNDFVIKTLEDEYQCLTNGIKQNVTHLVPKERVVTTSEKTTNSFGIQSTDKTLNDKQISLGIKRKISTIVENHNQFSADIRRNSKKGKLSYICEYEGCHQEFTTNYGRTLHLKRVHTLELFLKCDDCEKCFASNSELKRHRIVHSNSCEECHQMFDKQKDLLAHKRSAHSSGQPFYKCDFCDFMSTKNGLGRHIQSTHFAELTVNCDYEDCHQMFRCTKAMVEHQKAVHNGVSKTDTEFVCEYVGCDQKFRHKISLKYHIKRTHTLDMPFKCRECPKVFPDPYNLKKHRLVHSEPEFECKDCHKKYKQNYVLVEHRKRCHSSQKLIFKCNYCEFKHNDKKGLGQHITDTHLPDMKAICDYENCQQMFPNNDSLTAHHITEHNAPEIRCDVEDCNRMFRSRVRLNEHKNKFHVDHQVMCEWPGCGKVYKNVKYYKDHKLTHTRELEFKCPFEGCDRVFVSRKQLRGHTPCHKKNYPCMWPGCVRKFNDSRSLNTHMNKHKNIRPFRCHIEGCGKEFLTEDTKERHIKNIHENPRPKPMSDSVYKCDDCTFETRSKAGLKCHITKFHTNIDELTVKCDYEGCHKMFKTVQQMRGHRYEHTTLRTVYPCDWPGCDYTAQGLERIKDHKLSHVGARNFRCDFEGCPKSFVTDKTLRQHKMSHQKRFVCSWPECSHRFSDELSLTAHMNKHLNLRPFKCDINGCNKDFKIDRHLKHHIRTVHKIEKILPN